MSFKFTKHSDDELQRKHDEVKVLADHLQQLGIKIEDIERQISNTYDEISLIEINKERVTKRLSLLRENLSLKIRTLEQQVEDVELMVKSFFS